MNEDMVKKLFFPYMKWMCCQFWTMRHSSDKTAHDKTNFMTCAPNEDSDQPGHPPSLISFRCLHEETLGP